MKHLFLTLALILTLSTCTFASQIKLTWTDGCSGEANYEVWRSTISGDTGSLYAILPADTVTYTDIAPVIGLNSYRVRCTNGSEVSGWSGWTNTTIPLMTGAPSGLIATLLP